MDAPKVVLCLHIIHHNSSLLISDMRAPTFQVETPQVSYGESGSFILPPKKRRKSKMLDMEMELEGEGTAGGAAVPNVTETADDQNGSNTPTVPLNACTTEESREG